MKFVALVSAFLATTGFSTGMSLTGQQNQHLDCNRCIPVSNPCGSQYLMLVKITGEHIDKVHHDLSYKYEVLHDFNGNAGFYPERRPVEYPNKVCQNSFSLGQTYIVGGGGEWLKNDLKASHCDTFIQHWFNEPDSEEWNLGIKAIEDKCSHKHH